MARKTQKTSVPQAAERKALDEKREQALFPVPPALSEMPKDYASILAALKQRIHETRLRTILSANASMVLLYWDMGKTILDRQSSEGWGARVIDRLSSDLRQAFPDMKGLSSRNLEYMRAFAAAWPTGQLCKRLLHKFPGIKISRFWRNSLRPKSAKRVISSKKGE